MLALWLSAGAATRKAVYASYSEVQPILAALAEVLPAALKNQSPAGVAALWPNWALRHDAEIRTRLIQGEEDSVANFLLFGTLYTQQPRVTWEDLTGLGQREIQASGNVSPEMSRVVSNVVRARADDLVGALAAPGDNERLRFVRRLVRQQGYNFTTAEARACLRNYLLANVDRVLKDHLRYARELETARKRGDTTQEFAERSKLYRDRGLSLDTSLFPNFSVEESLKAMQAQGLLAEGRVRRVAIIGPGLDFADKQDSYDFYPQQTLQPFALVDTLLRLGLAQADALEVTTLDISARVNEHLARARRRAQGGQSYVVHLVHDPRVPWKPAAVRYWERFGDQIGSPVRLVGVPTSAGELKVRAVRIRPAIVSSVTPVELNIVLQHLDLCAAERFDLIVATNIFIYYGVFEQSLALANVGQMLRPGGFLLSNNALLELPSSRVRSVDYLTTIYSDRPDDGDHIVWYQRMRD